MSLPTFAGMATNEIENTENSHKSMLTGRLALMGAGHLGQLLAHHAMASGWQIAGFFDDTMPVGHATALGPVLGGTAQAKQSFDAGQFDAVIVAIGYKHFAFRQRLFDGLVAEGVPIGTIIHPSCFVDSSAQIGQGSVLLPGCTIDAHSTLGPNVLLNTGCIVAHDTAIAAHTFLGPGVSLAGFIQIGERCFLGIGTIVIDGIAIASGTQTGGGTVVTRSIEVPGLYVGSPARFVR